MSAQAPQSNPLAAVDPAWAWRRYEPTAEAPWDRQRAAHLMRRCGFGATWSQLDEAVREGCGPSVERLIEGPPASAAFYSQAEVAAQSLLGSNDPSNLPAWWLHVMLQSPHPLREQMTLFWHGHFATSAAKVTGARMLFQQHRLLREHALGRFGPLLSAVSKDPAMLVWLDSTTNHKARPNENFAREVMELFCLGLGNYSEHDIKEAARAFTGWEVRQDEFRFNRHQHDSGPKTVLGKTGAWTGDDVLGILLAQPATGRFLVCKLFRYFVSETAEAPDVLVEPLAQGLRERDYDVTWLLRTLFMSNLFYSQFALRQKIKSPVELAVGMLRSLEATANTYVLADDLRNLGQGVFYPPNVKGWDGGAAWINSSTLLARANLVWALVSDDSRYKTRLRIDRLAALAGVDDPAQQVRRLVELLLSSALPDEVYVQLTAIAADAAEPRLTLARVVQAIATLPEFQLA
jgi:hypothetical protein